METLTVTSLAQYLDTVEKPLSFLYRGVPRKDYELIPSIGRGWTKGRKPLLSVERTMFQEFCRRAIPRLEYRPTTAWEWLMVAQHYGMPTRLLDWTENALAALFFACAADQDTDGAVYVLGSTIKQLDVQKVSSPFDVADDFYISPPHISARIAAQAAFFTVSKNPCEPLVSGVTRKLIIDAQAKHWLARDLTRYGTNSATLFPDLAGLATQIAFETACFKNDVVNVFALRGSV